MSSVQLVFPLFCRMYIYSLSKRKIIKTRKEQKTEKRRKEKKRRREKGKGKGEGKEASINDIHPCGRVYLCTRV